MGTYKNLQLSTSLLQAAASALTGSSTCICQNECNLETLVRDYLGITLKLSLETTSKVKTHNKTPCMCSRVESRPFNVSYQKWELGKWATKTKKWHNDIVYIDGNKLIVVEIKLVDSHMTHLLGSSQSLCHPVNGTYHFNIPDPTITITQPCDFSSTTPYYSNLAEGQIWMDILRLDKAGKHFRSLPAYSSLDIETYILVYSRSHICNIQNLFNLFDASRASFLYHPYDCRSGTIDFAYKDQLVSSSGPSFIEANLIRVKF